MKKTKFLSLVLSGALLVSAAAYALTLGTELATEVNAASGSVDLWFDHVTVKTDQNTTKSTGMTSYRMYMAKNEIEGCQFFLSPAEDMELDVSVTDFVNADGEILETELFFEHYFKMITEGNKMMPDALPPVTGKVSIKAGNSQGFYFKTKTALDSAAGEYTATVTVKNGDEVVNTADITLTVWDFELAEETPITTVSDISKYSVYSEHDMVGGDDGTLYKNYYDFALENRVCAYTLPYDILSDEANEYLDNPRMNGFIIGGDYNGLNTDDASIKAIHEKLSSDPDWFDKGIWYYVDEPTEMGKLNQIKAAGERLAELYPGYQMVSPYFFNIDIGGGVDQIAFMSDYINVWCTKINAWTPIDTEVEGAIHMINEFQTAKDGDYASRMEKEVAGGDKNWVYYCWEPLGPYTTFDASRQTLEQRVALWQAMDNDVTGLLYFTSTEWNGGLWRTIHKTNAGGEIVYGDGILLYPGTYPGAEPIDGPISSMRFESLRDGIEDYMYLDMAKGLIDEDIYEQMMDNITVSAVEWTDDSDLFYNTRVALGNMIESALVTGDTPAESVNFKTSSGFTMGNATMYVGGAVPGTTVMTVLSSLKNMNSVVIVRNHENLGLNDTIMPGDAICVVKEDGTSDQAFTFIIKGSVNGDAKINLADASAMLKKIAKWDVSVDEIAADVTGDGKVNLGDVSLLLKKIAGWDVEFDHTPVVFESA